MFDDGPDGQGREKRQGADEHDGSNEQHDEGGAFDPERPGAGGHLFLAGEVSGEGEDRDDGEEPADEHGEAQRGVVVHIAVGRRGGEAGKRRAVIADGGAEGVEHLAEAVGTGIIESGLPPVRDAGPRGAAEYSRGQGDQHDHDELDVVGVDLLAEVFRRAAHHQSGDEDGEDNKDEHAVEPGAYAAKDDLTGLDVEQRDEAADGRERVMHGVNGAARGVGGDGGEQRGVEDAEANLFALHVAVGRGDTKRVVDGVAVGLGHPADHDAGEEHRGHRAPYGPAVALVFDHAAEVVGERARDREDREHLEKVGERRRIFERMGGVGVGVAAAVGAEHLDCDL